jgi:hypothetical protein
METKDEAVKDQLYEEAAILARRQQDYRRELAAAAAAQEPPSLPVVGTGDIEAIVAAWTGVPVERLTEDDMSKLVRLVSGWGGVWSVLGRVEGLVMGGGRGWGGGGGQVGRCLHGTVLWGWAGQGTGARRVMGTATQPPGGMQVLDRAREGVGHSPGFLGKASKLHAALPLPSQPRDASDLATNGFTQVTWLGGGRHGQHASGWDVSAVWGGR